MSVYILDYMYNNLDEVNRNFVLNLYKESPFNISKYKVYLNVYIQSYPINDKKSLIKEFNKKYKKRFFVIKLFLLV